MEALHCEQTNRRSHHDQMHVRLPSHGPIVSVHVPSNMTVHGLSACLLQAVLHHPAAAASSMPVLDTRENRFVGLFAERSGVFLSLEHLLTGISAAERNLVYSTHLLPPRPPPPPSSPFYLMWQFWVVVSLPFILMWVNNNIDMIVDGTVMSVVWLYHFAIQIPLQELYRHGPWFLGWEGASLPQICSRITYHGDEAFWYRNLEECERIYAAKEEAFLRLGRPFLWGVFFFAAILVVRFIVWEFFSQPPPPPAPPIDRDMVETYRAWQTLLRQFQRTWAPSNKPVSNGSGSNNHYQSAPGNNRQQR